MSVHKHDDLPAGDRCSRACCLRGSGLGVTVGDQVILHDLDFHLHCGEITALIGPNGAGKSTLFRSVLGQLSYQGNITFSPAGGPAIRLADGTVMGGTRPLIGYVPQSPSFDRGDPISVLDFFTAATSKWPVCLPIPQKYRERCRMSLERVHGGDLLDKPMGGLSGGQLQRVLLALALEPVPHILILDEPLSGVDIEGEHQLLEMLDELRTEYDLSILLSTHDFATLNQFADKVILLNKRILKVGPPDEVTASPLSGRRAAPCTL